MKKSNKHIMKILDPNNPTFEVRKDSINRERVDNLDALESMNEYKKKNDKKRKFLDIDYETENSIKSKTVKALIDLNDNVKLTSWFLLGKILMFAKLLSLMSFTYELVKTFYFADETVKIIYEKYLIEKECVCHVLTDADSTCLKFIFVSCADSTIPDKKFRDIIFEVIVTGKIYNRYDSSNVYWEKFGARKENLCKCLGYFEIEWIDKPCFVTVAVYPKEYYEAFEDNSFNKKHKRIKKGLPEMDFENYANRILSINECDFFEKPGHDVKEVLGLTVVDG